MSNNGGGVCPASGSMNTATTCLSGKTQEPTSGIPDTATADAEGSNLSDDSGVDLRGCQAGESAAATSSTSCTTKLIHHTSIIKSAEHIGGTTASAGCRKNKRKSSEPRKRRQVLQMKRFRWAELSEDDDETKADNESDQRPSSGDSGLCLLNTGSPNPCPVSSWSAPHSSSHEPAPHHLSVIRRVQPSTGMPAASLRIVSTCSRHPRKDSAQVAIGDEDTCHRDAVSATTARAALTCSLHPAISDLVSSGQGKTALNGKPMDRKRRIEANARERTRVHTISAAFESLRRAVPAYADSQKLSKLAILRIACQYILALACLNDLDYSREQRRPTFAECVDMCTTTIQAEGRARKRNATKE